MPCVIDAETEPQVLRCTRCGASIPLPLEWRVCLADVCPEARRFQEEHKKCERGQG